MEPKSPTRPPEWYLVRKLLYLAVEDYKSLVRKGVIKDGREVPLTGAPLLLHEGYESGSTDVQDLLDFFHRGYAKAAFNILGIYLPMATITRALEKNAWDTKKQHFDDL